MPHGEGNQLYGRFLFYLMLGSETVEDVAKDKLFAQTRNRTGYPRSNTQYAIHLAITSPIGLVISSL